MTSYGDFFCGSERIERGNCRVLARRALSALVLRYGRFKFANVMLSIFATGRTKFN